MTRLTVRNQFEPPPWLSPSHVPAFESLCERLQGSGVELSETDLLTVGRLAISEADLLQAERIAADCPLTIETKSNGEQPHPIFRRIKELRAEVRSWMRLLPRAGSGGRGTSLPPHVPTPAPAGGDAAEPPGQPSERLQRLRAILAAFASAGGGEAAGDGVAGAAAGVGGCVDAAAAGVAGGVAGAAGAGGCVDAAGDGAE